MLANLRADSDVSRLWPSHPRRQATAFARRSPLKSIAAGMRRPQSGAIGLLTRAPRTASMSWQVTRTAALRQRAALNGIGMIQNVNDRRTPRPIRLGGRNRKQECTYQYRPAISREAAGQLKFSEQRLGLIKTRHRFRQRLRPCSIIVLKRCMLCC